MTHDEQIYSISAEISEYSLDFADDSHIYVVYEPNPTITQGGTPKLKENPTQTPADPSFDKTSTDERGVIWYHVKGGWISSRYTTQIQGSVNGGKSSKSSGDTVKATGDVRLRKGPGLDYAEITTMKKGQTASYLGSTKKDARGVAWYKVSFNGRTGWVSSRYGKLR